MTSKIRIELNPWYNVNQIPRSLEIIPYLRHVDEICVVEDESLPELCVVVDGRLLGLVDPFDEWELNSPSDDCSIVQRIREFKPAIILKYQWRRGAHYPPGTISAGYPCVREARCPRNLLTRARPIDVTARMRVNGDYHWGINEPWMIARWLIVEQAKLLEREGWNSKWGFIQGDEYDSELWNAQIGFDWRGRGYFTYRLIEYIRAGVVPITRPLGEEWPVREDVILEDGIHCIFCSDPRQFANEAKLLLTDRAKLKQIRRNLIELWREKLCPIAQGHWIWGKLKATLLKQAERIG